MCGVNRVFGQHGRNRSSRVFVLSCLGAVLCALQVVGLGLAAGCVSTSPAGELFGEHLMRFSEVAKLLPSGHQSYVLQAPASRVEDAGALLALFSWDSWGDDDPLRAQSTIGSWLARLRRRSWIVLCRGRMISRISSVVSRPWRSFPRASTTSSAGKGRKSDPDCDPLSLLPKTLSCRSAFEEATGCSSTRTRYDSVRRTGHRRG